MKLPRTKLHRFSQMLPNLEPATGFRTVSRVDDPNIRARRGLLQVNGVQIETPALFPVINLLSGPPSLHRNGATHKFLKRQLIFEDRRPGLMCEALHFTDYPFTPRSFREWFPHTNGSPDIKTLAYWVKQSFTELGKPQQMYNPLFFIDSGGFRLLFNREVDIAEFGYEPTQQSILQLQLDYGGDIVTSLDYPIPPLLNHKQATERIAGSIHNAVLLMKELYRERKSDPTGKRPFPVLAVHGQTPDQIRGCVLQLFEALDNAGFANEPFGIGIGSLVPLRVNSSADKIVMLVKAVVETLHSADIPAQFNPESIPIHAFGITGDMIPVLAYLGVDTFDSSSYIKSASVLDYYDPVTWGAINFRTLKSLPCDCKACNGMTLDQVSRLQEVLSGEKIMGNKDRLNLQAGQHTVNIKSDVYGIIAYHNLCLQDREILGVRSAISTNEVAQHVVQFGKTHMRAQALVEFVAQLDPIIAKALGHVQIELLPRTREEINEHYNTISLTNDPTDFDVMTHYPTYQPPAGKRRLLLLACSQAKPYRQSKSHTTVFRFLREHAGDLVEECHKVTISGLYGPVPLEFEDEEVVRTYEYVLSSSAKRQHELVVARLTAYLEAYMHCYDQIVGYVTASAYRSVVEAAFKRVHERYTKAHGPEAILPVRFILVPEKARGTGTKDLLTHVNLIELVHTLFPHAPLQVTPLHQSRVDDT